MNLNRNQEFQNFGDLLRQKWKEVPATRQDRMFSQDLLNYSDAELLEYWEECRSQTCVPGVRGWYQELYRLKFAGLKVAEIGPGVGIDGMFFGKAGAHITLLDIARDNLALLRRISDLHGVKADLYFIDDYFSYKFDSQFDVMMFVGSIHNAPFEFSQRQVSALTKYLKPGGRAVILTYPKERYNFLKCENFEQFGQRCDGERTPWCEWYDDRKILELFGPEFDLNWSRNFGQQDIEFNWFDLSKKNN